MKALKKLIEINYCYIFENTNKILIEKLYLLKKSYLELYSLIYL